MQLALYNPWKINESCEKLASVIWRHFLIDCAQYDVSWPEVHMFPKEAVTAVEILGAGIAMPVHWGAFSLAYHAWDDSVERFVEEGERAGLQIVTPKIGETVKLQEPGDYQERWWREIP